MSTVKAKWQNGQVVLDSVADWPEGSRLVVAEEPLGDIVFMTEEQQSDDSESIQQWIDELRALPPLELSPEAEAAWIAWRVD